MVGPHMLKNARPFSIGKRIDDKAKFVDEAMPEHGVRQFSHAVLQEAPARLLFEFSDGLSHVPFDELSIPLKRLLQGSGCDKFVHAVYSFRLFSFSLWPDLGKERISFLTHQERIWHEQQVGEICFNIRGVIWKDQRPEIHILSTHSPVDRHFGFYNDFSHLISSVLIK